MGAKNSFMHNNFSVIHRKSNLDLMIYSFIGGQRFAIPSISVEESAKAFLQYNGIDEEELPLETITRSFWRTQKEVFNEQKTDASKG